MTKNKLLEIFARTEGHCHFCGDPVTFNKRGWVVGSLRGYWEVDHVVQRDRGGVDGVGNYLPACTSCNRLRWHRKGAQVRELLFLGLIAKDEIKKNTTIGRQISAIQLKRKQANRRRRK